jgi:glycerophosphoryl diester phosphodiesterase
MKRFVPFLAVASVGVLATVSATSTTAFADHRTPPAPTLVGRAVLPVATYAGDPVSGTLLPPGVVNGISFPLPGQPVQGFSSMVAGRHPGEFLAMPDNGFGGKATSRDFLIRAYYIEPDFKTARGGSGTVQIGDRISFRDPNRLIGFTIVNEATADRLLTGGDIDPESLQRGTRGDLWVGEEFGPWVLHFSGTGVLLDPPFPVPGNLRSPNNPFLVGAATHPNSRGIEAMAITPNGRFLYPTLEGATVADSATGNPSRRLMFEFDTRAKAFTGRQWQYRVESATNMVSDLWSLDDHRMVVIERDGGLGVTALFRSVYVLDRRRVDQDGFLVKSLAVDLTTIADPAHVSWPPIHAGDIGLADPSTGAPFKVVCESIETIYPVGGARLVLACDNNFPNKGRNPGLADDNEFIVVKVPGLGDDH